MIKDIFGKKNDIAIVFQSKSDQDEDIRLTLGPYQQSETSKYFNLEMDCIEAISPVEFDIHLQRRLDRGKKKKLTLFDEGIKLEFQPANMINKKSRNKSSKSNKSSKKNAKSPNKATKVLKIREFLQQQSQARLQRNHFSLPHRKH